MYRKLLLIVLLLNASLSVGCSSLGAFGLTGTSEIVEAEQFVPPHDPSMGQIVLTVPQVRMSAPVPSSAGDLGQAVRTQLTNALAKSPNFLVADRESLADIADEHRLADAGAIEPADRPVAGRLAGARYLVKVDVTELQEKVLGDSDGFRVELGKPFRMLDGFVGGKNFRLVSDLFKVGNPSVGVGKETVQGIVGMEISVVDVDSGLTIAATRAHATLTQKKTSTVLGVAGVSTSDRKFAQSVIAQATRVAAEDAVHKVHAALRSAIARGERPDAPALASAPGR